LPDAGGVPSHRAVVARGCGIPAVVGDGQAVEGDGDAGVLRILWLGSVWPPPGGSGQG
jgi:phosphoenolpyruvate synthase/pyruvate phosphate dikinase